MQSTAPSSEQLAADAADNYMQELREKILFGLSIYKFVSPTMLHTFLGTSTPSKLWKEQVLAQLLEEGLVVSENVPLRSPFERTQTYQILRLATNAYTPPESRAPQTDNDEPETVAA